MNIFDPVAPPEKWHALYARILQPEFSPERAVIDEWAKGFVDRDNKFVFELQTTFEPCFWELYLFAYFKELGLPVDFSRQAPDFTLGGPTPLCVEAVIAAPPQGGKGTMGYFSADDIPDDLNEFNAQAALRICNSFTTKAQKYQTLYSNYDHVKNKPFVIAIGAFDRPHAQLAANRPIMAALFGHYYDEELTLAMQSDTIENYDVSGVYKKENIDVPVGFFTDATYDYVSAVIYSPVATWGKVRALANNPEGKIVFTTFHPNEDSILPIVKKTLKKDYTEHLVDGLYVFHNPFAKNPLDKHVLHHNRIAQFVPSDDGSFEIIAPDDFLTVRFLHSIKE